MLVTGEAGTGKSSLCRWLAHQHPLRVLPERDVVELLITAIPPAASIASIASTMLVALGDPSAGVGTISQKTHRVVTLCRGCGVEMLLFDEAQHLQDRGDTKTHYMVGDWLKHLIDELAVPTVLLGLPRLENVLQINDQLRRRFSSRRRLAVGQSDTDSIETECLQLFLSLTSLIDIPVSSHPYSAQEMGVRLYYASDGRVAYIKKLLFAALRCALERLARHTAGLAAEAASCRRALLRDAADAARTAAGGDALSCGWIVAGWRCGWQACGEWRASAKG